MLVSSTAIYELTGIVIALAIILITYLRWSFKYWKTRNVPTLEPTIPFGNMEAPYSRKTTVGIHIGQLYERVKAQSLKYCGVYFFASPVFLVRDLNLLRNIMTKDFQYFTDRGIYYNEKDDPISAHLFAIGGQKWRNLRTKLTPTFTSGKMRTMFNTLAECGQSLLDNNVFQKKNNVDEPVDIKDVLKRFTTDVIGSCAFGLECNSIQDDESPFRKFGKRIFRQSTLDKLRVAFFISFPRLSKLIGLRQIQKDVGNFYMKIVKETVGYRESNHVERKDFLQLLIEIKNQKTYGEELGDGKILTIEEIASQSFIFFLAGFETSSSLMTFALYELAEHQDIQDRVRREIFDVLNKHDGQITYDSINDLKYMNQVLDEALRKYPPLPYISRQCVKDYKIPDSDVTIEKGTKIGISIYGIHYDSDYYPDPNKFDPERFSTENKQTRHPYTYLAFGEGPRICIGMRFGLMQSKVGLTTLLKNYKFTVNPKTQTPLKMDPNSFILSAAGGVWLNMEKLS